jgi:4-carboxymuconolactone decarboxylase
MRVSDIHPQDLSVRQQEVHAAIVSGPRGEVPMPLRVWLHSPELASRAQAFGEFCRYGTTLPPILSEFVILIVGAHWQASYEWQIHSQAARDAGLGSTIIDAVSVGSRPAAMSETESALYDFATDLLKGHRVSTEVYNVARGRLGETALVEIVAILGYYTLICMTIQAFEIPPISSIADPFLGLPKLEAHRQSGEHT